MQLGIRLNKGKSFMGNKNHSASIVMGRKINPIPLQASNHNMGNEINENYSNTPNSSYLPKGLEKMNQRKKTLN